MYILTDISLQIEQSVNPRMCGCPVTSLGNKFKISTKLVLEYTVTCLIVIKINPIATKKKLHWLAGHYPNVE